MTLYVTGCENGDGLISYALNAFWKTICGVLFVVCARGAAAILRCPTSLIGKKRPGRHYGRPGRVDPATAVA